MVSARLVRATAAGAAALTLAFLSTAQGFAQGKAVPKTPAPAAAQAAGGQPAPAAAAAAHPDIWYKLCLDVPVAVAEPPASPPKEGDKTAAAKPAEAKAEENKKVNVCLTQVDVRDNATAILIGKVAVRQVAGQPKPQMLAMLPLGSALPPGALVKIDNDQPIKLAYTTCDQAGCYAEANIEPATIDKMKTGKQIAYLGIDVTGRALSIPLPLEGFAKAFAGQPVPVEKYNEDQKKIAAVIRQRLATLRQEEQAKAQGAGGAQAPAAGGTPPAAPATTTQPKKK